MQVKKLEYIVKVAECSSITKAAQQLYISQPSLTKAIMELEQEYGIKILVRKPRGVELTDDGKTFIHYARGVLTAATALQNNFSVQDDVAKSRLFLATQQLDFVYDLLLQTYNTNKSNVIHYNIVETDRFEVVQQLLDGAVDIGLTVQSTSDSKLFLWHTKADKLNQFIVDSGAPYICVGPNSPYYEKEFITLSEASYCFQLVLDMEAQAKQDLYFDNKNTHFNREKLIFFNSASACEQFLLHTDALLFVSKWTRHCFQNPAIKSIKVIPDDKNTTLPNNNLVWLKRANEPLSLTEKTFIEFLYAKFNKPLPPL